MTPTDCNLGQLKRIVNCIEVSEDDQYMYCGTTSGDVIQVYTVLYTVVPLVAMSYRYRVIICGTISGDVIQVPCYILCYH